MDPRFRSSRAAAEFGERVHQLLCQIRAQLLRSDPTRQAFLRLIKEIIDFRCLTVP